MLWGITCFSCRKQIMEKKCQRHVSYVEVKRNIYKIHSFLNFKGKDQNRPGLR